MVKLRDRKVSDRPLDPDRRWKMLGETPQEHKARLDREINREIEIKSWQTASSK